MLENWVRAISREDWREMAGLAHERLVTEIGKRVKSLAARGQSRAPRRIIANRAPRVGGRPDRPGRRGASESGLFAAREATRPLFHDRTQEDQGMLLSLASLQGLPHEQWRESRGMSLNRLVPARPSHSQPGCAKRTHSQAVKHAAPVTCVEGLSAHELDSGPNCQATPSGAEPASTLAQNEPNPCGDTHCLVTAYV